MIVLHSILLHLLLIPESFTNLMYQQVNQLYSVNRKSNLIFQITKQSRSSLKVKMVQKSRCLLFIKRSEEHTSELQSRENLVCRLLLEKKKKKKNKVKRLK